MNLFASQARRGALALVAMALAVAVLPASASSTVGGVTTRATQFTPVTGAVFNRPVGSYSQQRAIFTHVNQTIDATPSGATIRFAVYSFAEKATADRLIAAHQRGVNVQLIFDNHVVYSQESRLQKILGKNTNAASFVKLCSRSCRGTSGNMHDKVFLFSQAGSASNVVMTGSNNMTRYNAVNQWSDIYTVTGDAALYFVFSGVFDQMKLDKPQSSPFISADVDGYQTQFYPYPGTTQTTDPLSQALSQVACTGVDATGAADVTSLKISQHAWNGDRGVYLADQVAALSKAGCDVSVIYGVGMGGSVKNRLVRAGVQVSAGTKRGIRTHEKYLLVDGSYAGDPAAQVVWTGSHNWSDGALTRDEIILKVPGTTAYAQYARNFTDIWNHG